MIIIICLGGESKASGTTRSSPREKSAKMLRCVCICICIFCIFISPISPMHFSQVIVQLWKGGRLCQDSLAADLAAAARW